jgi:ribosomal protein S18 acetylase RimI-like enzyme
LDEYLIEPITARDEPLLWEMLYQAIYVPAGVTAPPRQIVNTPELSRYVQAWGQASDDGMKAVIADTAQPIGAAWLRLLTGKNRGYGYIDDRTPELSIAISPEHRGKGVGTRLLNALLERARDRHAAVSLSVSDENPAIRLYQRLGFEIFGQEGSSLIMKKELASARPTNNPFD